MNYEVEMYDRKKRRRILHVNMLKKWHSIAEEGFVYEEVLEDESEGIHCWNYREGDQPVISNQLDEVQQSQL